MKEFWEKQRRALEKYSFKRGVYSKIEYTEENFDRFTEENMEYLCANAESGGLVRLTGTGFHFFFSNNNWQDENGRWADKGFSLICKDYHLDLSTFLEKLRITHYCQELCLEDGIVKTSVGFGKEKKGYQTRVFTSQKNKNLMCLSVTNTESEKKIWSLILPDDGYEICYDKASLHGIIYGSRSSKEYFTKTAWALFSEKPIVNKEVALEPGETVNFRFTFATHIGEGEKYAEAAISLLELDKDYYELASDHKEIWKKYWTEAPFIRTDDEEINKLFYRALYWELCQNGGKKNLPPEAAFAGLCSDCSDIWHGHPFSYGSPGQAVESLLLTGRSDLARNILDAMYRPEALISNAKRFTDIEGAYCFAHENNVDGYEIAPKIWWTQRHIDGFVAELYRLYYEFNPSDRDFFVNRVYPVFRGVAQFYCGCLSYSKEYDAYLFPEWMFLSEFGARQNTLDVVLNALFVFKQAAEYATTLGADKEQSEKWLKMSDKLYIPENDDVYLQYLGDLCRSDEGGGYYGKRAQVYLAIPYLLKNGYVNMEKAKKTITSAWEDNHCGSGMITFVAGWGARAAAYFGMGDLSLEMLKRYFDCNPAFICETDHGRPYFQCGFVKALLSMLVQGNYGDIRVFCAVPNEWKDVSFENVTTVNGIKVSGSFKNGETENVTLTSSSGKILHTQKNNELIRVGLLEKSG